MLRHVNTRVKPASETLCATIVPLTVDKVNDSRNTVKLIDSYQKPLEYHC